MPSKFGFTIRETSCKSVLVLPVEPALQLVLKLDWSALLTERGRIDSRCRSLATLNGDFGHRHFGRGLCHL